MRKEENEKGREPIRTYHDGLYCATEALRFAVPAIESNDHERKVMNSTKKVRECGCVIIKGVGVI